MNLVADLGSRKGQFQAACQGWSGTKRQPLPLGPALLTHYNWIGLEPKKKRAYPITRNSLATPAAKSWFQLLNRSRTPEGITEMM